MVTSERERGEMAAPEAWRVDENKVVKEGRHEREAARETLCVC